MSAPITGITKKALETSDKGWNNIFKKFAKTQTKKRKNKLKSKKK